MSNGIFYTTIVAFALGVVAASVSTMAPTYYVWGMMLGSVLLGISFLRRSSVNVRPLTLAGVVLVVSMIGVWRTEMHEASLENSMLAEMKEADVSLTGVVVREPDERSHTTHVYIETEGGVVLAYADPFLGVRYGDRVDITGVVSEPEAFHTDLGREFNYPGYLAAQGVAYVMYYPEVTIGPFQGNILLRQLYVFKDTFRAQLQRLLQQPQRGLGEGLLLGVKGALGEEWQAVFRTTGIIHIVVLSGYNVMLVILFVLYVLSYVLRYRARIIVGFLAVLAFAALVGFSATVVRASIMASLLLLLKFSGNTYNIVRALCIAGVLMLLWNPLLLLYDPGFQLSFLATLGLILLASHIEKLVLFVPTVLGVREFLVATVATQLFVLPLLLYQIGELSLVAVLVNVLVLPMVPVAMLLTFAAGMIGFVFPQLAIVVAFAAHGALTYILRVAALFSELPFAAVRVPAFSFPLVVIGYLGLLSMFYVLHRNSKVERFLAGWTIEDEHVLYARIKAASQGDAASNETPVFFK